MTDAQRRLVNHLRECTNPHLDPNVVALLDIIDELEHECRDHRRATAELMQRLEAAERVFGSWKLVRNGDGE